MSGVFVTASPSAVTPIMLELESLRFCFTERTSSCGATVWAIAREDANVRIAAMILGDVILVLRGAVDGVDDEDFDGRFGGDDFDTEVFFECTREGGSIDRRGGCVAHGCPFEIADIEVADEAGVIQDGPLACAGIA